MASECDHDAARRDADAWVRFEVSDHRAKLPDIDSFNLARCYLERDAERRHFAEVERGYVVRARAILADNDALLAERAELRAILNAEDQAAHKIIRARALLARTGDGTP